MKKKGFTLIELLAVIVIIAVISIISIVLVVNYISDSKQTLHDTQISKIISAAKDWSLENSDKLDEYHLNNTYISISDLKKAGFLNDQIIKDPLDGKEMNGCIVISYDKILKEYKYEYNTSFCRTLTADAETLIPTFKYILSNEQGNDSSLYEEDNYYIYKGTNPNNYLKSGSDIWRIVNINKDTKVIKLVYMNSTTERYWDNNLGTTDLGFKSPLTLYDSLNNDIVISTLIEEINLENNTWYVGNTNNSSNLTLNTIKSIEKDTTAISNVGLLSISDYMNASLNDNCTNDYTLCNNNYLNNGTDYWLINSDSTLSNLWKVNSSGLIEMVNNYQTILKVYPVVYIGLDGQLSGTGNQSDPYVLK